MQPRLVDYLQQKTIEQLKSLARLCGPTKVTRKAHLIEHIRQSLINPSSLNQLWKKLDPLTQKAVASAYHNDGEFDEMAFEAQYGSLPQRQKKSTWSWHYEPILMDLFIHDNLIPPDLIQLLSDLVPPPEKFEVIGLQDKPTVMDLDNQPLEMHSVQTEETGLHDLMAYLRLVDQGHIKTGQGSSRSTLPGIKKILNNLLNNDFLPLPEKIRVTDTIRPFGLDVFAQEGKLVKKSRDSAALQLTKQGREFYQTKDPELLLNAFETWTQKGSFDELNRISAIKGMRASGTRLTKPASRREAIIEALSWCPVGVWININDLYRAIKIWHFNFDVETSYYSNLYIGHREYGMLYGESYWRLVKGLYINAVLWEYLGSIGAVDLLYTNPEETHIDARFDYYFDDDYFSRYDGLRYFRINNLGAFLLGQVDEYIPTKTELPDLFTVSDNLAVTLIEDNELTPNEQYYLEQMAIQTKWGVYRLDTQRILTSLEDGADFEGLANFLNERNIGPLPTPAMQWLEQIEQNLKAFRISGPALLIKVTPPELIEQIVADQVLGKLCKPIDRTTVVIPSNKEKLFRKRLKELSYILVN